MIIYNKISDPGEPYKKVQIEINFPSFGKVKNIKGKEKIWEDDSYRSYCLLLNTGFYHTKCEGYFFFYVALLGFGFTIIKQTDF